ncbi:MAG: hypothetical protein AAFY11_08580 [Cyanobacteria bacterium J06641_5]
MLGVLGFWLSASLTLDALVMPSLASSGMMNRSEFAGVGYGLFGTFNRLELLCAALVLSGILALTYRPNRETSPPVESNGAQHRQELLLAGLLVMLAAISTYVLTPTMGAMGMGVDWLEADPSQTVMVAMHATYWGLEVCKFALGVMLLARCYRGGRSLELDSSAS